MSWNITWFRKRTIYNTRTPFNGNAQKIEFISGKVQKIEQIKGQIAKDKNATGELNNIPKLEGLVKKT